MNFNIDIIINTIKEKRGIFTSEADFQLEMAWTIKELYPNSKIRMEFCPEFEPAMHIDILVIMNGKWIPIELKYKTKKYKKIINDELFFLKEHSAKDINCYSYLKDLQRIEYIKEHTPLFEKGYTVFLTNDQSYLKKPTKTDCIYKDFSLANGMTKTGLMQWGEKASTGTKKGHEEPIIIKGNYNINWNKFSKFDNSNAGEFFILINTIK